MNLFTEIVGGPVETKTIDLSRLTWSSLGLGTKSGATVSVQSAWRVSAAFACTKVISEDVSKIPLKLFREQDRVKAVAREHVAHFLFARRPNDWMGPVAFRETLQMHACLSHGGAAYINRSSRGKIFELIPLLPEDCRPVYDRGAQALAFDLRLPNGETKRLPKSEVFYLHGLSWDTYQGLETVQLAREAIGLAIVTEESQARLHRNGGRPGGLLTTDAKLSPDQVNQIKGRWDSAHGGVGKWGGTALLDGGLKYQQLAVVGAAAETLESRRYQTEEQARFFRVYPQKIMHADKTATYASAEQFALAHVIDTILPWARRWEEAAELSLLSDDEWRTGHFFKLMLQGLLRGDAKTRSEFYASAITNGWMTRNEARALEELDALEGLDTPLMQLNMADGTKPPAAGKEGAGQPASR